MYNVNNKNNNVNYELEERVRILELTNYFLRIKDNYFEEDFARRGNIFFENAVDALEFPDENLDHEFYQACSRIEDMFKSKGKITKAERTFLLLVQSFALSYTKSKIRFYD